MAAYGLYTHIQSNKRRSVALLIGLFFLVYVMVFAGALLAEALIARGNPPLDYLMRAAEFDFIKAAPFATVGTVIWIFIAYKFHQSMIDAVTGAEPVTREQEPRLYNLLENLCISRGITTPTLRIADDEALNAFATGLNEKQYSITVTRGLIEALNDQELEAVLGHELTHIRNGDVRMMVIAMVIAGVISVLRRNGVPPLLPERAFRGFGGRRARDDRAAAAPASPSSSRIALIVVAWLLSVVIRFALSRQREYLADAGSVELTKNPDAMIIGAAQDRGPRRTHPRQLGGDGNVHRQSARGLCRYFRHPPLGRETRRGAGEIRRRPRSRPARTGGRRKNSRRSSSKRATIRLKVRGVISRSSPRRSRARGARSLAPLRQGGPARRRPVGAATKLDAARRIRRFVQ